MVPFTQICSSLPSLLKSLYKSLFSLHVLQSGLVDALLWSNNVTVSQVQNASLLQLSERESSDLAASWVIPSVSRKNRLLMQNQASSTPFPGRPPWWHILPLINSMRRWGSGRWPLCWLIKLAYTLLTHEKQLITCKLGGFFFFFLNYKHEAPPLSPLLSWVRILIFRPLKPLWNCSPVVQFLLCKGVLNHYLSIFKCELGFRFVVSDVKTETACFYTCILTF